MPRRHLIPVKNRPKKSYGGWAVAVGLCLFLLSPFIIMCLTGDVRVTTEEDRAKAEAAAEYLESFRVVRVCPVAPEAFGQFVMQGSDGRYWLSSYARPSEWRYVVPLGNVAPEQVC